MNKQKIESYLMINKLKAAENILHSKHIVCIGMLNNKFMCENIFF